MCYFHSHVTYIGFCRIGIVNQELDEIGILDTGENSQYSQYRTSLLFSVLIFCLCCVFLIPVWALHCSSSLCSRRLSSIQSRRGSGWGEEEERGRRRRVGRRKRSSRPVRWGWVGRHGTAATEGKKNRKRNNFLLVSLQSDTFFLPLCAPPPLSSSLLLLLLLPLHCLIVATTCSQLTLTNV